MARANLPDFFNLANDVIQDLGALPESEATQLLNKAKGLNNSPEPNDKKFAGQISADRIFGHLEQEFSSIDIYESVAKALNKEGDLDLSAHQMNYQSGRFMTSIYFFIWK